MVELFPRTGFSELFHRRGLSFSIGGGRSCFKGVIGRSDQKSVIYQ